jgi:hypothetical protein
MKKLMLKFLKPFIKRQIVKILENKEYKDKIITELNKKLDIPKVDEKAEEKLLIGIYDSVQEIAIEVVDNI